jgi:hypothetical protein
MLRTNLSTRPFYNVRAVHAALGVAAAIVLAFTIFNVVQIVRLSLSQRTLGASAAQAEDEAERLRAEAARIRARIDPKELAVVATAAREANAIIDKRAFSWSELLTQFEMTLPEDVRISAVQPNVDRDGVFTVAIGVEARRVEDLDVFIEALEKTGFFRDVLAVEEQTDDAGLIEAIVEGRYSQAPRVVEASRE